MRPDTWGEVINDLPSGLKAYVANSQFSIEAWRDDIVRFSKQTGIGLYLSGSIVSMSAKVLPQAGG